MSFQEEVPPLNPWPFLISDAVLLITALVISLQSNAPLAGLPLIAVAGCVGLGAVLAIVPFVLNHTRRQDLALAERQREIAALAQITATSAEQISIAASSLHGIAETASKAIKLAEHLPQKMQERINDFKTQINEVAVTENEALSQEINTLRTSETERLETALAGVRKTAADLAMIEAVSRKHLSELNESLSRFVVAAEKAASASTKTIETARADAEKSMTAALAGIDRKIASLPEQFISRVATVAPFVETKPLAVQPDVVPPIVVAKPLASVSRPPVPMPVPVLVDKKPETVPPVEIVIPVAENVPEVIEKIEPIASVPVSDDAVPPASDEKPVRKRAPRKAAEAENELSLGLDLATVETPQFSPEISAPAISSDGLTRLLVTAYIGIGNKLFVRGEGPGLSSTRGVPLQFVSIGKWRWESDVTAPVKLKLYKNDEIECTSVGALALSPGYQQEVTASFS